MALVQHANKGVRMNMLEQFYIQLYKHQNKLIPKQHSGDRKPLFDLVYDLQMNHSTT
jgi:hypothetical protein